MVTVMDREYLVIGRELAAVSRYYRLLQEWGEERVGFLCPGPIDREELRPYGFQSFSGRSLIYKDMAFHSIDERAIKSPWERHFFLKSDGEEGYPCLDDEHFMKELPRKQMEGVPLKIERVPSGGYRIGCHNGLELTCRHLYWMEAPKEFSQCYSEEMVTPSVPGSLHVRHCFESVVTEMTETLFFSLSYTHAQGHFFGVFQTPEDGRQETEFVTFLDMEETQEEDISKKIRILDRRLSKAFPNFKKIPHRKSIRVSSHAFLPGLATPESVPDGVHFP